MSIEKEPLFGRILDSTPFSERELVILIATAPRRYKEHYIEKRNGRGKRLISQPTAELKYLQRNLIKNELFSLRLHDAAIAYRPKSSIKNHAIPHASAKYLLKLDFTDFFPSLKESAIRHRLAEDTSYSEKEKWIVCQLLCKRNRKTDDLELSIGAPSSPFISNYLMWEFDEKLTEFCTLNHAKYSRYADDLAISTSMPHTLDIIKSKVDEILEELSYLSLSLNETKTVNVSKKNHRSLVGLSLANDGSVSVGRLEKRKLRATMNAMVNGKLPKEDIPGLRGKLAFIYSIDPEFVTNLCKRNGFERIVDIKFIAE